MFDVFHKFAVALTASPKDHSNQRLSSRLSSSPDDALGKRLQPLCAAARGACISIFLLIGASGCSHRATRVEIGDIQKILHLGNGSEPQDLDPQTVTGVPEHNIMQALLEGLASPDPKDLRPVPGVAERWEIDPSGTIYTFHLRRNARWSDGHPVTARDFIESFRRMLSPQLGAEYSYMLYPAKNAEAYNTGALKRFDEVGFKALDARTLRITLHDPAPYFLAMLSHESWFPVPIRVIEKYGGLYERGNRWTRPGHYVGNGPFVLKEWKVNDVIAVEKNPFYWDAARVRLRQIRFYPIESRDTEERAFRAGELHVTETIPLAKIPYYQREHPDLLRIDPYLGVYFYLFNVTRPPLNDKRVRRALAMAIDRVALVKDVTRAGELPAYCFTPPDTAGYTCRARLPTDIPAAQELLAEAGYPGGRGFPRLQILFNTDEEHRIIGEAIQQMWRHNLHIEADLINEEWKVFLDSQKRMDYMVSRFGWIGDYVDPSTFLDIWVSGGGNNRAGWSNPKYDALIAAAGRTGDNRKRFELFQQAEAILLEEAPIAPIYFYTQPFLIRHSVRGWFPNILNTHPYKYVDLVPSR